MIFTATGRLTRKELFGITIEIYTRKFLPKYVKRFLTLAICIALFYIIFVNKTIHEFGRTLIIIILLIIYYVFRVIWDIITISRKIEIAQADTTVTLTEESVATETPGRGKLIIPRENVRMKRHKLGIICETERYILFLLPYRVLSPEDIECITQIFAAPLLENRAST